MPFCFGRDGQNRYFEISKRYRRTTRPAFRPAALLRRTSVFTAGKNLGAGMALPSRALKYRRAEAAFGGRSPKRKDILSDVLSFWCARRESNKPSYFLLPFSRETWRQNLGFPYRFATFTSVLSHQFLPIKGKPKGKTARPNRTAEITSRRALSFLPRPPDW